MFIIDPLYLLFALPGVLLSLWASVYTRSTFAKFSRIRSSRGLTGAQAAYQMLARKGVRDVSIEQTAGMLTDHYDPRTRTLRLSSNVYNSTSLAAIGVACHEAGHALQHAANYTWLGLRSALVPVTSFGSNMAYILFIIGFIMRSQQLILFGALLFSVAVIFSIITLPVEWNASARAKVAMVQAGIVSDQESRQAGRVLNAAFLTYVAAAVSAILTLLYYLLRAGVFGSDD
jgi:Zn-dependent membrane protease YugP